MNNQKYNPRKRQKRQNRQRQKRQFKRLISSLKSYLSIIIAFIVTVSIAIFMQVNSIHKLSNVNDAPQQNSALEKVEKDNSSQPNKLPNILPPSPSQIPNPHPEFSRSQPQLPSLLTYNVKESHPFYFNSKLQLIVDKIVSLAKSRKLPIDKLSISLINLNSPTCCDYAGYQDQELRYPASIVKLFWLVMLYQQYYDRGLTPKEIPLEKQKIIAKAIEDSDNEAASQILDQITKTESSLKPLPSEQLYQWINQRYLVNEFYQRAGYPYLNISQKTFPISNDITEPIGPDQQIRQIQGKDLPPTRNFLSTYAVARLLGEIAQEQTISPEYSQEIKQLLKRDLNPSKWQRKPFNPIAGFLGESLPRKTEFWAKMGWTFNNRNDAAIISSPNREINYILVIFGDDAAYYQDKRFFPLLSKQVFETSFLRTDSL